MAVAPKAVVSPKKTPTKTNAKKRKNQEGDSTKEDGGPSLVKKPNSSKLPENLNQHKGNKVSRVRVVGKRVYDSLNGTSCHQCRQKTLDFAAECKNIKNNKQCTIRFCHKCLLNRYGEKAEDVSKIEDWKCPKCRFICNCSFCMKKKGQKPTGILVHTAKASGFLSVSQLLHVKGPDYASPESVTDSKAISLKKSDSLKENAAALSPVKASDNGCDQMSKSHLKKSKKLKREKSAGMSEVKKDECNANSQEKSSITDEAPHKKKLKVLSGSQAAKPEGITNIVIGLPNENMVKKDVGSVSKQDKSILTKEKVKNKISKAESVNQDAKPEEVLENVVNGLHDENIVNKDVDNMSKQEKSTLTKEKVKKKKSKEESVNQDAKPEEALKKVHTIETIVSKYDNNARIQDRFPITKDKPNMKLNVELDRCAAKPEELIKELRIVLPKGTVMTSLANIDLPPEDVGNALQLMEFCAAFGEILDVKKGQPALVLRDIMAGRSRRGKCSALVQFQIQLLSVLQNDSGEMSNMSPNDGKYCWLHALKECISDYDWALKDFPDHCFDGTWGYEMLSPSQKLKVVIFLCDETLSTAQLRTWIEEQNEKFKEKRKEAKEKVVAAKEKERVAKKKMQDEIAATILARNGSAPISIAEHEALFTEIRAEAERVHAEMLETMGMVPKDNQLPDGVRTSPVYLDAKNGPVYWRLKGYNKLDILLQDVGLYGFSPNERWFCFNEEDKKVIEEHILFPRIKRQRKHKEKSLPKMENDRMTPNFVHQLKIEEPK